MITAPENMHKALLEFCETIEATGGCVWSTAYQNYVPSADHEWSDLAYAYISACKAIGRNAKLRDNRPEEEDGE